MTDLVPHFFTDVLYNEGAMRFECKTHSGAVYGFHGQPEVALPNGWPLVTIEARLSRTREVRPAEFYDIG